MSATSVFLFVLVTLLPGAVEIFSVPVHQPKKPEKNLFTGFSCAVTNRSNVAPRVDEFRRVFSPGKNLICAETCLLGERRQMCVGHKHDSLDFLSIMKLTDDLCNVSPGMCRENRQQCSHETKLHPRETIACESRSYSEATFDPDSDCSRRCQHLEESGGRRTQFCNRAGEGMDGFREMKSCVASYRKVKAVYDFLHGYQVTFKRKEKRPVNCICLNGSWFCDKSGRKASDFNARFTKRKKSVITAEPLNVHPVCD